jgi:hypothetical protein
MAERCRSDPVSLNRYSRPMVCGSYFYRTESYDNMEVSVGSVNEPIGIEIGLEGCRR